MIWGYPYFRKPPFMEQTWDVNGSRMSCEEFDPSKKKALKKCIYVDPTFESLTEITQKCIHILGLDKVDKQTIASKNRILTAKQQLNLSIYLSVCLSVYLSIYLSIYRSIDLSIYRSMDLSITTLVSKSWSIASFPRHFASYCWSFQM